MSGGYFCYRDVHITDIARSITRLVQENQSTERDIYGGLVGRAYPPEIIAHFVDAVSVLRKAAVYAHRIDYLLSGDDGEVSFLRRIHEDLDALQSAEPLP